jgi:hypothetical protein
MGAAVEFLDINRLYENSLLNSENNLSKQTLNKEKHNIVLGLKKIFLSYFKPNITCFYITKAITKTCCDNFYNIQISRNCLIYKDHNSNNYKKTITLNFSTEQLSIDNVFQDIFYYKKFLKKLCKVALDIEEKKAWVLIQNEKGVADEF